MISYNQYNGSDLRTRFVRRALAWTCFQINSLSLGKRDQRDARISEKSDWRVKPDIRYIPYSTECPD